MNQISVGIVTVSDRASAGVYDDLGGPALASQVKQLGWNVQAEAIVPDEIWRIQEAIQALAAQGCQVVLTTGGTGIARSHHTPLCRMDQRN